jgi:hypothetical protein
MFFHNNSINIRDMVNWTLGGDRAMNYAYREMTAREKMTARAKISVGMRIVRTMRKCGGREQELVSGPGTK